MERVDYHYYCDACREEVRNRGELRECAFNLPISKVNPNTPDSLKNETLVIREICPDCYEKVESVFIDITKELQKKLSGLRSV